MDYFHTIRRFFQRKRPPIAPLAKNKQKSKPSASQANKIAASKTPRTLAELRSDQTFSYKIKVLVHDFLNLAKDDAAKKRLNETLDVHYISTPYFTPDEATLIKAATVKKEDGTNCTIEELISTHFENFLEKRRASGDARPCGPHDMAPVYLSCFGIDKGEFEDEKFLSRLRRSGLSC
ncbi:hypothetical protein CLAFUW4_09736 [Fulvia fulva]|uniref:Uncharacterized protein n=1 Tax=Passalora fulva TaxID=5499 RepID=A0A9Q8PIP1_PASFU|nr:uncharacterized protein CLAFUR5_12502 [Fulvia fulva]KAK4616176.1 hypothetical protein CLAFUR4_09741 [Fulvia fulva]KAK4616502.1 hypothetical protein CLAFUR0_09733 [Fulvia fulva]UJO23132.1 hypothetical protein CLAFUR5_12502 [Fulvia fulva]WPV19200.1 hypothetical protein CLAFUW4_09736 [Fulvia fulva]WPV34232.1 hypothetical protein CLAFUW7_09738 [Fulvia fulva]